MRAWQLLARGDADQLADARELARLGRLEREAERVRVGDRVPHTAEGHVDRDRAEPVHLEGRVETVGEAGDVRQLDALAPAVAAPCRHLDDAGRRLQAQSRLRLAHLDHARLEEDGRDADRVRAGHRRILGRLHDDEAGVAVVAEGWDDQVGVHGDTAPRLAQEEPPQGIVRAQRLHALVDGVAGRCNDAADDDVADLAAGVAADHCDDAERPHGSSRSNAATTSSSSPSTASQCQCSR